MGHFCKDIVRLDRPKYDYKSYRLFLKVLCVQITLAALSDCS